MAEAKTKQAKIKKKHWVSIHAPKTFNNAFLGETLVDDAQKVIGKSVTTSLMVLTDDPRKQAYSIRFDVTQVKDGKAIAQVVGMEMTPSAVKRLIRRHRDKISDSFVLRIGGGRMIRVKPMLVTRSPASKNAQTAIRLGARQWLRDNLQRMRFDDIILDVMDMKVQRTLRDLCSKTHPLKSADIKEIILLNESRAMTKEMEELLEREVAEEEAKRQQLQAAVEAASAEEPVPEAPKKRAPKKKKEDSEETVEEE